MGQLSFTEALLKAAVRSLANGDAERFLLYQNLKSQIKFMRVLDVLPDVFGNSLETWKGWEKDWETSKLLGEPKIIIQFEPWDWTGTPQIKGITFGYQ